MPSTKEGLQAAERRVAVLEADLFQFPSGVVPPTDGFGVCILSLHRACRLAAGAEGIMRLVREREAHWGRLLGVQGASEARES